MFSLMKLAWNLKDSDCPDPVLHIRMLRAFCGVPNRPYFQCVAQCSPLCHVPDRIAVEMWEELQSRPVSQLTRHEHWLVCNSEHAHMTDLERDDEPDPDRAYDEARDRRMFGEEK